MKRALWLATLVGVAATVLTKGQYCLPIFSGAGADAISGLDPYILRAGRPDYFKYSPVWALLLAPLHWIPAGIAPWLWCLLNAAAFWLGCWIYKKAMPSFGEAILLFPLMLTNGFYGQINSVLWLLIAVALAGIRKQGRGPQLWAGVALSAAGWMKLFPWVLAIPALRDPRRNRSFLLGVLLGIAAGVLLPWIAWQGSTPGIFDSWLGVLARDMAAPHHKIGLMSWLSSWTGEAGGISKVTTVLALGALACVSVFSRAAEASRAPLEALWITTLLFFSHMTEPPTLALLAPAVLVLAGSMDWKGLLPAYLLLLVLPSDLTPPAIKALLGGQYSIKTLALLVLMIQLGWLLLRPSNPDERGLPGTR